MIGKLFSLYLDSINNLHKLCRTFSASALDYCTLFQNFNCGLVTCSTFLESRATEILKSKSVRLTDDVIGTCVRQSQIVKKTNDSSFSSKSVSEIDYFSNTL